MKSNYPHIFEPFTVRRMTMKNRIMMTPMGTNFGEQTGEMSFLHINYYELRAKGGTGLLMVENASVFSPQGSNGTTQLRIDQDNYIPRLFLLCEKVHKHGACIGVQINHAGASAISSRIGMQPVSSSDVPSKEGGEVPRPLEKEEIYEIVKKYGEAAKRAQTAGFDCVEIHCGHSYLISQFLSPVMNKRTDEFGGSPENRARFAKLVIEEVRRQVGPFFPIFVRISADEFVEGGNTLEDTLDYLQYFQEEVDVFDVSAGLNQSIQFQIDANYLPDGWRSYMAKAVKEKYGKPCITMGNIRDPKVAEDILARGDADLIGMGRGLIADPDWCNKVELGHEDDLRKCISCNVGCAGHRIGLNQPVRCTVNPAVTTGEEYNILTPRSLTKMAQWMSEAKDEHEAQLIAANMDACWNMQIGTKLMEAFLNKFNNPAAQVRRAIRTALRDNDVTCGDLDDIEDGMGSIVYDDDVFEQTSMTELMEVLQKLPEWGKIERQLSIMAMTNTDDDNAVNF